MLSQNIYNSHIKSLKFLTYNKKEILYISVIHFIEKWTQKNRESYWNPNIYDSAVLSFQVFFI